MNEGFSKKYLTLSHLHTESSDSQSFSERELEESISEIQGKYVERIDKQLLANVATSLQKNRKDNPKLSFKEARTYALHEQLDQYSDTSWAPYVSALGVLFGKHSSKKSRAKSNKKPPIIFSAKRISEMVEDSKSVIDERNGDPDD
ncbi:hypothetical protein MNBD_CPR01-76 [hydrothermal vent metagenome]|uniref:Uncharacterized protein n=1 Tax=hydrothermal vent metagenome TaxID=652676 RepID=A0A3B0UV78_9ZZZZ